MMNGKRTLVTGSSLGIGLGIARAFASQGARVVQTSHLSESDVHERVGECYIQADLSQNGAAEQLVRQAWDQLGGLDVLVNNLGTYREPPLTEITREDFDFIFGLNVWSGIAATQEFVRLATQANTTGRIIFSTSINAVRSEPQHTLYDASKGAVNALVRQLAIELAPLGITVVAVAPGLVETPLTDWGLRSDPAGRQAILDQIPLRRIATVDDLVGWYVFLASDAASYATGSIFGVDGGLDAQQMALRPITDAERS